MNRLLLTAFVAAGLFVTAINVRSQAPAPAQTPLQALQALRAGNQKLLEQQNATLKKLEELQKEAHQLRLFARRS